ncbi:hypothetical protein GA0115233_12223, partial [Streptomyces sp. DI166]
MSSPRQYENGMNAAEGAQVYVPRAAPPPEYEGYRDPAAAHGWQNAYDETRELPRVPGGA